MALTQIDHVSENDLMAECIDNCLAAVQACEWCADECLGDPDMEKCARLCRDVADLTAMHARFMAPELELQSPTCSGLRGGVRGVRRGV